MHLSLKRQTEWSYAGKVATQYTVKCLLSPSFCLGVILSVEEKEMVVIFSGLPAV